MNNVGIVSCEVPPPAWSARAESFIFKTLEKLEKENWELSLVFCGNSFIKNLNREYRGRDEETDILSFPQGAFIKEGEEERFIAGDIIISLEALTLNSREFNTTVDEELRRLLVHGVLHLAGFTHSEHSLDIDALRREPMLALQEKILSDLENETIIEEAG